MQESERAASAAHIKQLRKDYNKHAELNGKPKLSQGRMAEMFHVTREHYAAVENGRYSLSMEMLLQICNFYGVSADYVLGRTNEKYNRSYAFDARIAEIEEKLNEIRDKILHESANQFKQTIAYMQLSLREIQEQVDEELEKIRSFEKTH